MYNYFLLQKPMVMRLLAGGYMDIVTPFGNVWRVASNLEIAVYFFIILLIIAFLGMVKYYNHLKYMKINDHQLFLFRMKRLGMTNFQIKIINNMVQILRLSNPNKLLKDPGFFEDAVGEFLNFLKQKENTEESLTHIFRDISIIYEKLYHKPELKKPLDSVAEIEDGQILYFSADKSGLYLGSLSGKKEDRLFIKIFTGRRKQVVIPEGVLLSVNVWRRGDAEYFFRSPVLSYENDTIEIGLPEKFSRGRELRHPYADTIITAEIRNIKQEISDHFVKAVLFKINDYETVARIDKELNYSDIFVLDFELMEFKFKVRSKIIANRTIEEGNIFYYTFRFEDISDAGKEVLKRFMYETR